MTSLLSGISPTEKGKHWYHLYVESKKHNKLVNKSKKKHSDRENTLVVASMEREGGGAIQEWKGGYYGTTWRRQWQPTPVLLPGKSHGWRSLVGCSPCGGWESDTTERLPFHFSLSYTGEGNGKPTPVFLPGESQGQGSLVGCHLWGRTEPDTTEAT